MSNPKDPMPKQESSVSDMLWAFLLSAIFGLVALLPWMVLKDALPLLIFALGGYQFAHNAFTIGFTIAFGVVWLVLTSLLWHRLEKDFSWKKALLKTLTWCAIAAVVYLVGIGLLAWSHALLGR